MTQPKNTRSTFKLDYSGKNIPLQDIFNEHSLYLSKEIVSAIMYAIDNQMDKIYVGTIFIYDTAIDFTSSRDNYYDTLQANMKSLIKHEEYELCSVVKNYLKKLLQEI